MNAKMLRTNLRSFDAPTPAHTSDSVVLVVAILILREAQQIAAFMYMMIQPANLCFECEASECTKAPRLRLISSTLSGGLHSL